MSYLQQYLLNVQNKLETKKFQSMWNICSQFYEFGIMDSTQNIQLGIEFSAQATTTQKFIQLLLHKHFYISSNYLSPQQNTQFDQAFSNCDKIDQRQLGKVIGMIILGGVGFLIFGFALLGILGGSLLGLVLGHQAGKRIQKTLANKKDLKEIDIYELRVRCLLKWSSQLKSQYQYNINFQRLVTEKLISELKIALHANYYSSIIRSQLIKLLKKVLGVINQEFYLCSIELHILLIKELIKVLDCLENKDTQFDKFLCYRNEIEETILKGIDNFIKPIVTLFYTQLSEQKIPIIIQDAKKFIYQPSIMQLSVKYPDPQMSIFYIKMLGQQLNQKINIQNLKQQVQKQNFKNLETMGVNINKQYEELLNQQNQIHIEIPDMEILKQIDYQAENLENECEAIAENQITEQKITLQLKQHPNKIQFCQMIPKIHVNPTPLQSLEDFDYNHQLSMRIQNNPSILKYPIHYNQQIIDKFELFQKLNSEPSESWDLCINSKDAQIYKTFKEGSDTVYIKGYGIIRNATVDQVLKVVYDIPIRKEWDKLLRDFSILKKETEDIDIVAYYVQPPISLVTPREWVQRRILRHNFPVQGETTLLFYSIESQDYPINKNRIRAHTGISSMIFQQWDENSVKIQICSNNDIKGYIPKLLVNRASASGPVDWFRNLQEACNKYKNC